MILSKVCKNNISGIKKCCFYFSHYYTCAVLDGHIIILKQEQDKKKHTNHPVSIYSPGKVQIIIFKSVI